MPDIINAKSNFAPQKYLKELKINGREYITVDATSILVSPLQKNADVIIESIAHGQKNNIVIDQIIAGDYTLIDGMKPLIKMYIDTDETFYIKF